MFYKKLLIFFTPFIFLLLLRPYTINAQKDSARIHISFNVGVGACFGQNISYFQNMNYKSTNSSSFLAGLSCVYKLNKHFSVGADLIYDSRGTDFQKLNDSLIYVALNQTTNTYEKKDNVYYYSQNIISSIDVPLYFKFGSYNKRYSPFINAGINSSFVLHYTQRYNTFNGLVQNWNYVPVKQIKSKYSPGIYLSAGIKIKRLILQLNYSSFINTEVIHYNFNRKINTHSIIFAISFIFLKR